MFSTSSGLASALISIIGTAPPPPETTINFTSRGASTGSALSALASAGGAGAAGWLAESSCKGAMALTSLPGSLSGRHAVSTRQVPASKIIVYAEVIILLAEFDPLFRDRPDDSKLSPVVNQDYCAAFVHAKRGSGDGTTKHVNLALLQTWKTHLHRIGQ